MDGIIIVNKEKNYTSRDVVNIIEGVLHTKKVGHAGTLDPIATGVLVVGINKGTKLLNKLILDEKEYVASCVVGVKTDTFDITGKILEEKDETIKEEEIKGALKEFTKTYMQQVPIYSATKIYGRKLYDYARKNIIITPPKKEVTIHSTKLLEQKDKSFKFYAKVSKGTYIRSLINDLGVYLNKCFTMEDLVRTSQGKYKLEEAYTLEDIKNNKIKIISIEEVLDAKIEEVKNDVLYKKVKNGNEIKYNSIHQYITFTKNNEKIAVYEKKEDSYLPFIMY